MNAQTLPQTDYDDAAAFYDDFLQQRLADPDFFFHYNMDVMMRKLGNMRGRQIRGLAGGQAFPARRPAAQGAGCRRGEEAMKGNSMPARKPRRGLRLLLAITHCLFFVALFLSSCSFEETLAPAPTRAEPLAGTIQVRESVAGAERTVDVLYVRAHIEVDDAQAAIDGRNIATEKLALAHCASYFFDGETVTAYTSTFPQNATTILIAHYRGVSLSYGGDNVLEEVLGPSDGAAAIPLALDEAYTFYTVQTGPQPSLNIWFGEQEADGETVAAYERTAEDGGTVAIRESHSIELIRNVPLQVTAALGCD